MNISSRAMSALNWAILEAAKSMAPFDPDSRERKELGYKIKMAREAYEELRLLRKELAQGARK